MSDIGAWKVLMNLCPLICQLMEVRHHRERKTHFVGSDLCYGKKENGPIPLLPALNHFCAFSVFFSKSFCRTKYPLAHGTDAKEHFPAHASIVQVAARCTEFRGGVQGAHAG